MSTFIDLVKRSFPPVIAVLTSDDVDTICAKNNVSFADMLMPFATLTNTVSIKDVANPQVTQSIRNLCIDFRDLRKDGFLLSLTVLPSVLAEAVAETSNNNNSSSHSVDSQQSASPVLGDCSWYRSYRDTFLYWAEPAEHEYLRNYIACILAVSTSHADPLEELSRLSQSQNGLQHVGQGSGAEYCAGPAYSAPARWFLPNIFKYHILVHDVSACDDRRAEELYQSMKVTYGANCCHLLRINSIQIGDENGDSAMMLPDPWHQCIERKYCGIATGLHIATMNALAKAKTIDTVSAAIDVMTEVSIPAVSIVENGTETPPDVTSSSAFHGCLIPHALSSSNLPNMADNAVITLANMEDGSGGERSRLPIRGSIHRPMMVDQQLHGRCLSSSDRDRIRTFVHEFVVRALVPFVERQMRILSEQLIARKGISRSLTTGVRKWFSGSSNALSAMNNTATASTVGILYTSESAEMQTRRLADLAMLMHNYAFAYQLYQTLKKDFLADQAWLHHAGALEMSAICSHLLSLSGVAPSKAYPQHYMDNALTYYMHTCLRPILAGRAALFSAEMLVDLGLYSEAAHQLIRLTTADDNLRSALFLEQAAYCFERISMNRIRTLDLVLSGHRYGKANNIDASFRCYRMALPLICDKGWIFAENHIRYTLAQQWKMLGKPECNGIVFSDQLLPEIDYGASQKEIEFEQQQQQRSDTPSSNMNDVNIVESTTKFNDDIVASINCDTLPIACTLTPLSTNIAHDFGKNRLCTIPITMQLFNRHPTHPTHIIIRCATVATNNRTIINRRLAHFWLAKTVQSVDLAPSSTIAIQLYIATNRSGFFDISSISVDANVDGIDYQVPISPVYITVSARSTVNIV